jgi:hypothetical protein
MSLPNDGEANFKMIPEKRYQAMTAPGPIHPIT